MNNQFSDNSASGLVCNDCGTRLPSGYRFCTGCGGTNLSPEPVPQDQKTGRGVSCRNCGGISPAGCRFCISCGAPLNAAAEDINRKNATAAQTPAANPSGKKSGSAAVPIMIALVAVLLIGGAAIGVLLFGDRLGILPADDGKKIVSSFTSDDDSRNPGENHSETPSETPVEPAHELPDDVLYGYYYGWEISGNTFDSIIASSYADWSGTRCVPADAYDGNIYSAWQDGKSADGDYGVGEWLMVFNSDAETESISSVTVYNGYQSTANNTASKDFYYLNSRVRDFTLEFDDGSTESFTLSDTKDAQTFNFATRETCFVRFTIDSVYHGDAYSDTCIGEIIIK